MASNIPTRPEFFRISAEGTRLSLHQMDGIPLDPTPESWLFLLLLNDTFDLRINFWIIVAIQCFPERQLEGPSKEHWLDLIFGHTPLYFTANWTLSLISSFVFLRHKRNLNWTLEFQRFCVSQIGPSLLTRHLDIKENRRENRVHWARCTHFTGLNGFHDRIITYKPGATFAVFV